MAVRERETTSLTHRRPSFVIEWIAGAIGALATAIGLWMYHAPSDGVLQLFGWDWDVAELSEAWPIGVIIAGAAIMATVFARVSQRLSLSGSPTGADVAAGASIASILLAVVYVIVWIV